MDNIGRAIDIYPGLSAMMKVEEQTRGFIAQHAIDSGIQNVLFTDIRTADDARECVAIVRPETPELGGVHGATMRRAVGYVMESGRPTWVQAMKDVVIALMIEKKPAVDNLEEILAVDGVDMVQFGPNDYSVSVGKPGGGRDPEVQEAHRYVIETALEMGKHPRVELGSLEQAQPWIDMGVKHFCVGWDIGTIFGWCKQQGELMGELGLKTPGEGGEMGYAAAQR
jgi:4-hydroxy-2-oxoheptanedioate aldolase